MTPWTVPYQAPLSMESPRPEYWNGLLFPSPGNLSDPGVKSVSPASPTLEANSLPQVQSSIRVAKESWALLSSDYEIQCDALSKTIHIVKKKKTTNSSNRICQLPLKDRRQCCSWGGGNRENWGACLTLCSLPFSLQL